MIHKSNIEKYNGSIDDLVEDIGNLRYDVLSEFLQKLSSKLESDYPSVLRELDRVRTLNGFIPLKKMVY